MKFIKKHKFIFFLIICFVLGFITMPLFHNGYFSDFFGSFLTVKWYFHILLFFGLFFLTLILHELTHFLTFVFLGYENEALIILFFVFYKLNGKWKIKIDFKLLVLGGGLAYPSLGEINSLEDYNKARDAMIKSLIAAPIMTLLSGLVLFILTAFLFYKIPLLVAISIYTLFFSLLYTYVSTKETSTIKGDFKAYKRVKTDDLFSLLILLQYSDTTNYLYHKVKQAFLSLPRSNNMDYLSFLSFLVDKQLYDDTSVDVEVFNAILPYLNKNVFRRLLNSLDNFKIAQSLILYFYNCSFNEDALSLFEIFKNRLLDSDAKDNQREFLLKQTLHLLKLEDHFDFINKYENINDNSLSFIIKHVPSYLENELKRNSGVTPFDLECKI